MKTKKLDVSTLIASIIEDTIDVAVTKAAIDEHGGTLTSYLTWLVSRILNYIKYFNNLKEDTNKAFAEGVSLDELFIIDEFAEFIQPRSIRYDASDKETVDLRLRDDKVEDESLLNEAEWVKLQNKFRSLYKMKTDDRTQSIASLRRHVSLGDVIKKVSINEKVRIFEVDGSYIPIPVNTALGCLFTDDYFNSDIDKVLRNWVRKKFNNT